MSSRDNKLHRALPASIFDLIRFGVPGNHRQVWGLCVSAAMSAYLRGWTENQFIMELSDPKNRIWWQLTRKNSPLSACKSLSKAWEAGVVFIEESRCWTLEEIKTAAEDLASRWINRLTDNPDGLSPPEVSVMRYVAAETSRRGMLKVTCPVREAGEFAKISHKHAHRILSTLTEKGFVIRHSRGRPNSGTGARGRAAIYSLSILDDWPSRLHR